LLVLLVLGVAAGLGVSELLLRLVGFAAPSWYRPNPRLGWALRPGAKGWFTEEGRAWVEINPAGQRDVPHALSKPPGTYRVALLGDSYAEAMQVDVEDTFWWLLQARLNQCGFQPGATVEVLNFGVAGYGTAQEYLTLASDAMRYAPDLVMLAFTNNDVVNNSSTLEVVRDRPFFHLEPQGQVRHDSSFRTMPEFQRLSSGWREAVRAVSDHVRVLQLARTVKAHITELREARRAAAATTPGFEVGIDPAVFVEPRDTAWRKAWRLTESLIELIRTTAARGGAQFVLVVGSHPAQVDPDTAGRRRLAEALQVPDLFYVERRLSSLGEREGFPVIPLAYGIQQRADSGRVYFHGFENVALGIGHWNLAGHRTAAELIAQRLCRGPQ
jgi:hypothetical protein